MFSVNGRMHAAMALFADVVTVNVLVVISSIPLVTAGASLAAAYSVIFRRLNGEHGSLPRLYVRSFRSVFRRITPLWGVFVALILLAVYEIALLDAVSDGAAATMFRAFIIGGSVIVVMIGSWVIPVAAVGGAGPRDTLGVAVSLAFRKLPRTLSLLLILLSPWALAAVSPMWAARVLLALLTFGTGLVVYLGALIVRRPVHRVFGIPVTEEPTETMKSPCTRCVGERE
ncbi:DUF624 domain-containing protein [Corynebacterium sp. CCM 9204]|uniref:DUF624 domain-containing protein n=1 Tax=Corynebacterium sp. CCM 9204 TaxID=3057616 RepID=UPI0035243E34